MIKIFNPNDRSFNSNGNLVIDAYKCIETKKKSLNGWFIDVETTVDNANKLEQDMLCVVKTKSKINPQAFRIKNIKKTSTKVSFQAEHVLFDARDYFLVDARPTNLSAIGALKYINERVDKMSPFRMDSNVNSTSTAYFINRNLLEAWTVIEERWGGIFDADNFNVTFTKSVGSDKGETLTYGSNLERVEVIEDWSNVVTRIYPVGPNGITPTIKYYDADISYPTNYTKKISFESQLEDDENNNEEILIDELVENTLRYLDKNKYPRVSYLVKSDVKQNLEIGDLIRVLHPLVNIETEVQEYTFDLITRRTLTLEFGNYSRDVKKAFDAIKEDIQKAKDLASTAEYVSSRQTDLINNLNKMGLVYIDDNEILILDKLPKETAKNVWRFGLGGIGFSDSGYEGPFDFAFTMDGYLNTMFINAGSITTNHLSSDVGSSLDLSSNESINLIVKNIELTPGPKGETGEAGADGIGIESTEIRYQKSTSGTETPTGQWLTFIPIVQENEYLWTRITIKYTTGPDSVSYTIGGVGSQGSKGDTGADGKGIATTVVDYQISESGSAVPTGTWSATLPPVLPNEYLWTRTTINYTTGSPSVAYSVGRVGKDGAKGDKGDTGSRGATGSVGPRGEDGTSVTGIVEFYGLSTSDTVKPTSWTEIVSEETPLPKMTSTNKYLWNYEKINFSNSSNQDTVPVIVGVYGETGSAGSNGIDGRSIVSIKEKYLVTSASSGVTRSTSGWGDAPSATSDTSKYLWNYEIVNWNKAPTPTYVDPIIIGVHGLKGDKGATGETGVQGPPGTNGLPTYTWIAYATSATGANISLSPTGKDYVGYASGQTSKTPVITTASLYTWQLVKGATGSQGPQGIQGGTGPKGDPVYTWIKYADTPTSGMTDDPTDKKYIGMAYNKATPTESTAYNQYQWSLMPQNITVGGRNYFSYTYHSNRDNYDFSSSYSHSKEPIQLQPNTEYTFSYEELIRFESGQYVLFLLDSSDNRVLSIFNVIGLDGGTGPIAGRKEYHFTTNDDGLYRLSYYANGKTNITTPDNAWITDIFLGFQLEKGNVATDWTPAPEDVSQEIADAVSNAKDEVLQVVTTSYATTTLLTDSITSEVTARETLDGELRGEISSQVKQTRDEYNIMFKVVDIDDAVTDKPLGEILSFFRVNENGVIIGKSDSTIEFFAENDIVGFRESGSDKPFAYWEGGTMNVDRLIAITTIMVGYHLIEKYDSPIAGKTTLVRIGD